nr:Uncharacterised protein [Raoultella sp. NCTC 9187]
MAQLFAKLHAAPAVTQGDSDRTLSGVLTNNMFVQFADNFAWVISDMGDPYALEANSSMVWKWLV